MSKTAKCTRCKKPADTDKFCQGCKSDLLQFYEATQDWNMAYEMDVAQKSVSKYNIESDFSEFAF